MNDKSTPSPSEIRQGSQESRQDRKQDDVAKQRPGQRDQQVRDAHSRSPQRKDGGQEPA
ncbi:hypothetical protein ABH900_002685 [Stenotrophomonas sp. AN71]|uniref:hypothetical protein n=1 Tax=Stenotrophomonas sp. AN71 TaxID=3156253 RepID=UPI003D1D4B35